MAEVDPSLYIALANPQNNDTSFGVSRIAQAQAAQFTNAQAQQRQLAGQLFSQGRYQEAAQALAPVDLQGAEGLQDRTSRQQMLGAAANGDLAGAREAGAQTGDTATFQAGQGEAQGVAAQRVLGLRTIAARLKTILPQPGNTMDDSEVLTRRAAAVSAGINSGAYDQFGLTPDMIRKSFLSDPSDLGDDHLTFAASPYPYTGVLKKDETAVDAGAKVGEGFHDPIVLDSGPGTSKAAFNQQGGQIAATQPGPVPTKPTELLKDPRTGTPIGTQTETNQLDVRTNPLTGAVQTTNTNIPAAAPGAAPAGPISHSPASIGTTPTNGAGGNGSPGGGQTADQVWANMVQRESGGRPGATGPQTPYGVAHGSTQMLDGTAQAMAQKLGLPWRPDLMRGTTADAAQYQQTLGRAYYDEGRARAQAAGVPADQVNAYAAAYYQGGPNAAMHGPQNAAYVHAVTGTPTGPTGAPLPQGSVPAPGQTVSSGGASVVPAVQYGLRGERKPDGSFAPTSGANYTTDSALATRRDFLGSKTYEAADNAVTAANALHSILNASRDNSGLVSMAALDNTIRAQTNLSARANQVDLMMDHLGVPNEIRGKVSNVLGKGFLTPGVIEEASSILDNYARTHVGALQRRAQVEQGFAKQQGFTGDLGLNIPQLTPPSTAKWLPSPQQANQNAPPNAGAGGGGGVTPALAVSQARAAIAAGRDRGKVIGRLMQMSTQNGWGLSPGSL